MTNEEILYDYYLNQSINSRNEAIELLKKRDFNKLYSNYFQYIDIASKEIELKSVYISDIIKELNNIVILDNETEPILISNYNDEHNETTIYCSSKIYTIRDLTRCENLAKHYTSSAIFKIKHQPNGKDTKSYEKIIDNHKSKLSK